MVLRSARLEKCVRNNVFGKVCSKRYVCRSVFMKLRTTTHVVNCKVKEDFVANH